MLFVLVQASDASRRLINLYAGMSDTDPSLNTHCNNGSTFYQDGAVNCGVENAQFVIIQYADGGGYGNLYFEEMYIYTEIDIAPSYSQLTTY